MFASYLGVLEAVAYLGDSATIGNVQKMNLHMTRGQVQRIIKSLMGEGYLTETELPYGRTGKKVYHPTERCRQNVSIVAKRVDVCVDVYVNDLSGVSK